MINLNEIIQGSALERLKELESESVDCCITSPPYWALRDYKTEGQIGLEPTFTEYITKLIRIFLEVKRVLKKSGSCWVNMGDTYAAVHTGGHKSTLSTVGANRPEAQEFRQPKQRNLLPEKSLCLIPQRFQIAMVDAGWICRNTIIWYKPNCMPSSAKDRFTVDFEYLFFFVKNQKYYFDTQYEPLLYEENTNGRVMGGAKYGGIHVQDKKTLAPFGGNKHEGYNNAIYSGKPWEPSPYGRIKRCVWKIPTQPFSGSGFLADYVGTDGRPYKASPNCPVHAHLASPQVQRKVSSDEQSTSVLNHNLDKLNDHVSEQANESYAKSLNSNDTNKALDDIQQTQPNIDAYKSLHEHEEHYVHDQESFSQSPDHTKHIRIDDEQMPYKTSCLNPDDSQTATYHSKENHRSNASIEQHDNAYDRKLSHTLDIGLVGSESGTRTRKCVCSIITVDHFAVFPPELVETPIKATCPEYVCKKCGKAREKIIESVEVNSEQKYNFKFYHEKLGQSSVKTNFANGQEYNKWKLENPDKITGLTSCNCNAGYDGGIVLDCFLGSGTTAIVAMQNARNFLGIELNPEYIKMAYARLDPFLKQQRMTEFAAQDA